VVCPLHAAESLGLLPIEPFQESIQEDEEDGALLAAKQRSAGYHPVLIHFFLEFQERVSSTGLREELASGSRSFERILAATGRPWHVVGPLTERLFSFRSLSGAAHDGFFSERKPRGTGEFGLQQLRIRYKPFFDVVGRDRSAVR